MQGAGQQMVHLPVALGAIGVFHSVPLSEAWEASGEKNLRDAALDQDSPQEAYFNLAKVICTATRKSISRILQWKPNFLRCRKWLNQLRLCLNGSVQGGAGLKLSPCVLAKIMKGEITTWDHAARRRVELGTGGEFRAPPAGRLSDHVQGLRMLQSSRNFAWGSAA